ncbi:MAG: HisA/HisF-related TIM barrel protein [Ilumatobacteraceae bacterium]
MSPLLYPSIDLLGGDVVRLQQGDYDRVTNYSAPPTELVNSYADAGCRWLHVVDLDAARSGDNPNLALIAEIVAHAGSEMRVQVGGGVRSVGRARELHRLGVHRVVIGSAAVQDPPLVSTVASFMPVCVGLDHRDGFLATDGWTRQSDMSVAEALDALTAAEAFLITDIGRDGMLSGPDLAGIATAVETTAADVIASGGVGSLDDIASLAMVDGLHGVITGRALMENRFTAAEAIAVLEGAR